MCGIVGFVGSSPASPRQKAWLSKSLSTLNHRGPDSSGVLWSECSHVGFGHTRLAIHDLSKAGHQPMTNQTGLILTFNGEIYNYVELRQRLIRLGYSFRSNTDTEVVLAAYQEWGDRCLDELNGMFAFALFDPFRQSVFLARDRAGEKPLYYYHSNGEFYFASELKALFSNTELPRSLNYDAFDYYLAFGFSPGRMCLVNGYHKLEPGHYIKYDLLSSSFTTSKYWKLPSYDTFNHLPEEYLVDKLESLLLESVKQQLVADVPVGILLSGGTDSSLITALASRLKTDVKTFSITFPKNHNYDEGPYSRRISQYFNTDHTELVAEPHLVDTMNTLTHHFDEPVVDSSMFPTWLVCNLVSKYCTVAIGGDGGDELFGGYNHYSRLLKLASYTSFIPHNVRKLFSYSSALLPVGFKGRNYLNALGFDYETDVPPIAYYFDRYSRHHLTKNSLNLSPAAENYRNSRVIPDHNFLNRLMKFDFHNFLAEDVLVKADRVSMSQSLELRSPFLDQRIIEFAFSSIPSGLKANTVSRKIVLQKLAKKILPRDFDARRKQGFCIPIASWLRSGPFKDLFVDTLYSRDCTFDRKYIDYLFAGQESGYANGERLFALVQFELWRKAFGIAA